MGRIRLHQSEYDQGWMRFLFLTMAVLLFGFFTSVITWLMATETRAGLCEPLFQARLSEWTAEAWSRILPLAVTLVVVPVLASLAIGAHTLCQGGILGFLVSLFNTIPFYAAGSGEEIGRLHEAPLLLIAFLLGSLLAFYAGDAGSWLCRRRLRQESCEEAQEQAEREASRGGA
jgi:hypothetical protein